MEKMKRLPKTESCESDETEGEEVKKPFRPPPRLPDPLTEETWIRESITGCLIDVTAKAESRLHPRYKQMKNARPFEGIVSDKSNGELSDHKRLSILRWKAGPKSGEVTNSMVGVHPCDCGPRGGDPLPRDHSKRGATVPHLPGCRPTHPL